MTAPILYACSFGTGLGDQWPRLLRTLAYTAERHCPDWTRRIERVTQQPPSRKPSSGELFNTWKLDRWYDVVASAPDDSQILLMDADTIILRALDPVWEMPFDVAYTVRPKASKFPLNAGVVFVRATARARGFLQIWRDENRRMLADKMRHMAWRRRYAGMNQAALGCVLESSKAIADVQLARLSCAEWNCEDTGWEHFDPTVTRILHIKSQLRLAIFHGVSGRPYLRPLVAKWRRFEQEALGANQQVRTA